MLVIVTATVEKDFMKSDLYLVSKMALFAKHKAIHNTICSFLY